MKARLSQGFAIRQLCIVTSALVLIVPGQVVAALKISVQASEKFDSYTKVYVAPIRSDLRKVQPRVVQRLKKAGFDVVDLNTEHLPFASQGTGFALSSEGHILTCAHVVGQEANATLWVGTNRSIGQVKAVDTNLDVALVLLEGDHPQLRPLAFAVGSEQRMGQDVFTMGFPVADYLGNKPRLSKGVISSTVGVHDDERYVQISIPIQPGNSGSPLLDDHGSLVGMVSATINPLKFLLLEGSVPQNVNFAVKAEFLQAFLAASKISLPQSKGPEESGSVPVPVGAPLENASKSLVLIRGGIVDEQRLKERPLVCRCLYGEVINGRFFRLRLDFLDVKKFAFVLTATLDESSTASEDRVLDAMCEQICDKVFPDRVNPFNPKKSRR